MLPPLGLKEFDYVGQSSEKSILINDLIRNGNESAEGTSFIHRFVDGLME